MPNIIDVIIHGKLNQTFLVLDEMPNFLYEKKGSLLVAEDDGFYDSYGYERPSKNWEAFGGRKFQIPLKNGEFEDAYGQWWACPHPLSKTISLKSVGISTIEELTKCYVFCSGVIATSKLEEWLAQNKPSTEYYKYKKAKPNEI